MDRFAQAPPPQPLCEASQEQAGIAGRDTWDYPLTYPRSMDHTVLAPLEETRRGVMGHRGGFYFPDPDPRRCW